VLQTRRPRLLEASAALLTVREVAALLSVATATVYDLVERGELAHVRVSNAIRIARADLEAFLARGSK
jgi:excisionase family DNA binding protein